MPGVNFNSDVLKFVSVLNNHFPSFSSIITRGFKVVIIARVSSLMPTSSNIPVKFSSLILSKKEFEKKIKSFYYR